MCRERTSRTFFGESCSRATVDMVPLLEGGNRAKDPDARPKASTSAARKSPPRGRRPKLLRRQGRDAGVLEARGRAAVLAVLLGAVERRVRGAQQLVFLLLDRGAGCGVRADRGQAERR